MFSYFIFYFDIVFNAQMNPVALCLAMYTLPYFPCPIYSISSNYSIVVTNLGSLFYFGFL